MLTSYRVCAGWRCRYYPKNARLCLRATKKAGVNGHRKEKPERDTPVQKKVIDRQEHREVEFMRRGEKHRLGNRQAAKVAPSCRPRKEKEKPKTINGPAHERMGAS